MYYCETFDASKSYQSAEIFSFEQFITFYCQTFLHFILWQKIELYRMDLSKVHFYVETVLFISRSFPKPSCYRLFNLSELYLVFSFLKDRHFYSIKMNVCTCM